MQSIYERIHAAIRPNGELPDVFSLLAEEDSFDYDASEPDGTSDGIFCCNGKTPPPSKIRPIVEAVVRASDHEYRYAEMILKNIFNDGVTMLPCLHTMQLWIQKNNECVHPLYLYMFARHLLLHSRCLESVKFALSVIQMFPRPADAEVMQAVREFGASDEFALFVLMVVMNWVNGNEEVFRIAQTLHGWGRIHAVRLLKPETAQIRRWLLCEGASNTVNSELSAPTVAEKVNLPKVVRECDGNSEDFRSACDLFRIMVGSQYTSSTDCFSVYSQKEQLVRAFLDKAKSTSNEEMYATILIIRDYYEEKRPWSNHYKEFVDAAKAVFSSEACAKFFKYRILHGESIGLAAAIGLPCKPDIKEAILTDWRANWKLIQLLEKPEEYVVDVARVFLADMEGKKLFGNVVIQTWRWLMDNIPRYSAQEEQLLILGLDTPIEGDRHKVLKRVRRWKKKKYMTPQLSRAVKTWRRHEKNWELAEYFFDL